MFCEQLFPMRQSVMRSLVAIYGLEMVFSSKAREKLRLHTIFIGFLCIFINIKVSLADFMLSKFIEMLWVCTE